MFSFVLLLIHVHADIPVNCNYQQIIGTWTFHLDQTQFYAGLLDPVSTCGHGQPDSVNPVRLYESWEFTEENVETVTLSTPNIAESDAWDSGEWTMIANEGFLVQFPNITFFAYSKYSIDTKNQQYSECDQTMLGWYRPRDGQIHSNWGCFYGLKDTKEDKIPFHTGSVRWVSPTSFLQAGELYDDQAGLVHRLNTVQSQWTAGFNDYFRGMSMMEVNSRLGVKRNRNKPDWNREGRFTGFIEQRRREDVEYARLRETDAEAIRAFLNTPAEDIPLEELPEHWDWSDIDGQSYLPARGVMNQGDCGSCFAISAMEMLESRLRVMDSELSDVRLSVQYLVSCGFYTEGCDGGFPTLALKFISEFGIPSESCMKYKPDKQPSCSTLCSDSDIWVTVDSYGYLGGYYGAGNEDLMMKELRARGPFAISFEPGFAFSYYRSGIFSQQAVRENSEEVMRDTDFAWEQVDHTVLLVGWGEERGVKYWKLMNSWGKDWGEKGFFRMRRGVDESGVGSMPEVAVPRVIPGPIV